MKTILKQVTERTIEEFADAHDLTMEVHERAHPVGDPARYYAHFSDVEEKRDGMLVGTYGNGVSPEEAIADYARQISLKWLVYKAYSADRKDIIPERIK